MRLQSGIPVVSIAVVSIVVVSIEVVSIAVVSIAVVSTAVVSIAVVSIAVVSIAVVSIAVVNIAAVSIAAACHVAPVLGRVEMKIFVFVFTRKFCEKFLLTFCKKSLQKIFVFAKVSRKYSIMNADPDSGTN
jgi:hypothetical protein